MVMFQAINLLSGDSGGLGDRCGPQVQECWEFEHPRKDAVTNAQGSYIPLLIDIILAEQIIRFAPDE